MRKICILALFLLIGFPLYSSDNSNLFPDNSDVVVKIDLSKLAIFGGEKTGLFQESSAEIEKKIEEKTGMVLNRDLRELSFFMIFDAKKNDPNGGAIPIPFVGNIGAFLSGNFVPEKLLTEIGAEKGLNITCEEIAGKKAVKFQNFTGIFKDNQTFCMGLTENIEQIVNPKVSSKFLPSELTSAFDNSSVFVYLRVQGGLEKIINSPAYKFNGPPQAMEMIQKLKAVSIYNVEKSLSLSLSCIDEAGAKYLKDFFENAKIAASSNIELRLLELNREISEASLVQLLKPDMRTQKLILTLLKAVVAGIKIENIGSTVAVSILLPSELSKYLVPENVLVTAAVTGVLAAVAIPNFRRAREEARKKACYANMRVILGATEMYNMDHSVMKKSLNDEDVRQSGELVKEGYLKSGVTSPEPGCKYFSEGDLTGNGQIRCTVHGTVPNP